MSPRIATPARLEAFSDGVIAVIITIMVLELKVPHEDGLAGLRAVLPILCLYLISFAFVGIYWINHHHLIHRTEEADERILYANLGFLFWLAQHPAFRAGDIDTGFIARYFKPGALGEAREADLPLIGAALAAVERGGTAAGTNGAGPPALPRSRWRELARREALRE